ncbi:hypothetical protein FRX31_019824 [Thalictrum thalictroides]|uniref:Transmembrane protein n=1 Tax=Thalictrum thalictroides TaxID=46969 RepID=A0A7J6W234_THATH|nr:hypothetical protein FRX31_019824 [Thalictrum thalictroides]
MPLTLSEQILQALFLMPNRVHVDSNHVATSLPNLQADGPRVAVASRNTAMSNDSCMPTEDERLVTFIVVIVIAHMMIAYNWWYRAYNFLKIHKASYVNRNAMRTDTLARFYLESDNQCHHQLRMRRPAFHTLCRRLRGLGLRNADFDDDTDFEQPKETFAASAPGPSTDVHAGYSSGTGDSPKTTPSPPIVLPKRR